MTNRNSVRCHHCNLLNFNSDIFCKRCQNPLLDPDQSDLGKSATSNQHVGHQLSDMQPTLVDDPNKTNVQNRTRYVSPPPRRAAPQQNASGQQPQNYPAQTEYQVQNQHGLEQWKQEHRPVKNHHPQQNYPASTQNHFVLPKVFRNGDEFAIHQYARMPDSCVKCNEYVDYDGGSYATQKYRWHNPLLYVALISPLIYLILSLVLSKRVKLNIPLCQDHLEDRSKVGTYLISGGVIAAIAFVALFSFDLIGSAFLVFIVSFFGLMLGREYFYKPLQVSKIDGDYVHLKGACTEYLDQIPSIY